MKVDILSIIKCPDCGDIGLSEDAISLTIGCTSCSWFRPFSSDKRLLDLLPTKSKNVDRLVKKTSISEFYYKQFQKDLSVQDSEYVGWSIASINSNNRQIFFLKKLKNIVTKAINLSACNELLIDFSAGSGDYTFENTKKFDMVLHCDINGDGLISAKNRAEQLGIYNVIFIRCDYLQLPFVDECCDVAIMIDSLEYYGYGSDKNTVDNIYSILKVNGIAILDFHRKRLLKGNNVLYEYNKKDINLVCKSNSCAVSSLGDWVIGRVSSISFSSRIIYSFLNWMFFLPAVRSIRAMRRTR
jgi:ubiquinone/menaquinone biosynthesis C-methylase UbiE